MKRSRTKVAAAGLGVALAGAAGAWADGASTIASAPQVAVGQQQFGNTASVPNDDSGYHNSYWQLSVQSGDRVTIDWESQSDTNSLRVYPVGTTDFNVETSTAKYSGLNSNRKAELIFSATRAGSMPLDFRDDYDGSPYDFIVSILHGVRLGLPRIAALPASGSVAVGVHTPDGAPINDPGLAVTLQAKRRTAKHYKSIGTAPATNGTATITYTVPSGLRHKKIYLRARAAGPNYVDQVSATQKSKAG